MSDNTNRDAERNGNLEEFILAKARAGEPHLHLVEELMQTDALHQGIIRTPEQFSLLSELAAEYVWQKRIPNTSEELAETLARIGEIDQALATHFGIPQGYPRLVSAIVSHYALNGEMNIAHNLTCAYETNHLQSDRVLYDRICKELAREHSIALAQDYLTGIIPLHDKGDELANAVLKASIKHVALYRPEESEVITESEREEYVRRCRQLIGLGKMEEAGKIYNDHIDNLFSIDLPSCARHVAEHQPDLLNAFSLAFPTGLIDFEDECAIGYARARNFRDVLTEVGTAPARSHRSPSANAEFTCALAYHGHIAKAREYIQHNNVNESHIHLALLAGIGGKKWSRSL